MSQAQANRDAELILDQLDAFDLRAFGSPEKVAHYIALSGLDRLIEDATAAAAVATGSPAISGGLAPDYADLSRIHWLTLKRRALNVLEMGSGKSSLVVAHALSILNDRYGADIAGRFRNDKDFHLYSVDESDRYLDFSRALVGPYAERVSFSHSAVRLAQHDSRFVTHYDALPNICPDLIYLDGPSQNATDQRIDGFSIDTACRMPMSADILRIEFFLEPGTLVLIDGRSQNARFLRSYLKRNWAYFHDPVGDIHCFELQEPPLGRLNQQKIDFCLGGRWLLEAS